MSLRGKGCVMNLRGIGVAILLVGSSLAAVAVGNVLGNNPPASTHNPPIYPSAQQVVIHGTDQPIWGKSEQAYKTVSFQTADSAAAVIIFYAAALHNEGWQTENQSPDPDTQIFVWFGSSRSPDMYTFELTTKTQPDGGTSVVIKLDWMPGY